MIELAYFQKATCTHTYLIRGAVAVGQNGTARAAERKNGSRIFGDLYFPFLAFLFPFDKFAVSVEDGGGCTALAIAKGVFADPPDPLLLLIIVITVIAIRRFFFR